MVLGFFVVLFLNRLYCRRKFGKYSYGDVQSHCYVAILYRFNLFLELDAKNYIKYNSFANMAKLI